MSNWLSSEAEILKRIASSRTTFANTICFALDSAFPYPERAFAQDVYVAINVPRTKLQLSPCEKPGDIDYLIVPSLGGDIQSEQTIAIEAKVLRPSVSNPGRNANAMGRLQVAGLLRDGFPFVGLVHISVPEPLPPHMLWRIPVISNKPGPKHELIETEEYLMVDPFPLFSATRQEGRVLALDLPAEVGYRVIAMTLSNDGEYFSGNTIGEERRGLRNPHTSNVLLDAIRQLITTEPNLFTKVRWYSEGDN